MNFKKLFIVPALVIVSLSASASNTENWDIFTDIGAYGLIGVALAVPAYKRDWDGFRQAGYSVAAATGVGLVGKSLIDDERPDQSGNDSFPSNHTAGAFSAATTLKIRYGWKLGLPAYGLASLTGVGRIEAEKHHWKDVLAGAFIGTFAGWLFTDAVNENIIVVPKADRDSFGLALTVHW